MPLLMFIPYIYMLNPLNTLTEQIANRVVVPHKLSKLIHKYKKFYILDYVLLDTCFTPS